MPLALLAALAASLAIHAAALFLPDVDLSTAPEPPPITVELQPPPRLPAPVAEPPKPAKAHAERRRMKPAGVPTAATRQPDALVQAAEPAPNPEPAPETKPEPQPEPPPAAAPAEPLLPSRGYIRFAVYKGAQGFEVGRAEHRWEFADGRYRLTAVTETTGLVALFKSLQFEMESRGRLTDRGLQPEHMTTRRNGSETNEKADFDWDAHRVVLARDGSQYDLRDGAQDVVSFHYQLAYVANLADGASMGVATARKFERYRFDALGEESLDTPAGHFRTLHLRVQTDSTTEVWLALDRQLLPVKIRHTDRKGDSFEQVATEIGM